MRVKRVAISMILIAAAVIYAQDVAEIFNELTTKTVSVPLVVTPAPVQAPEPAPAVTVSNPAPDAVQVVPAVTVSPASVEPVRREPVEPAPAVVEAEVKVVPAVKPPEGDVQSVSVAPEIAGPGSIKNGLISLNLKEVELSSVIRLFATLSDANIIVPTLDGGTGAVKVDVNLKNVEWRPALQSILDAHNLELYEKTPGSEVYSVRKKPADAPLAMNVKAFKLDYASVSNVNDMIKVMVPEKGRISVYPARNTIVVQSTPENLLEIQAMIAAVDLPRQQVFIEAKFMELTDSASEKLGIDWAMLGGYGVGVNGIGGSYNFADSKQDGINNSVGTGGSQFTDIAGRPYENLDKQPSTTIANPAGGFLNNIDYAGRPGSLGPNDTRTFGVTPTGIASNLFNTTSVDDATVKRALGATLSASDFKVVLAALKDINGIKVVSNPKIIVANEETAKIYIGQKEPNIKQTITQVENTAPIKTYNLDTETPYFEYGIKLEVTPVVNTSSNISVAIAPTLSRFLRNKQAGDNTYPVVSEKTIKSIFSLASGQTAAIGGLTELTANDVDRKIPLLGSLPLIGRFFSYSEKNNQQAETVIFVTVGLANPANIDMETGLPQDSILAMRYDVKSRTDKQIKEEERKILQKHEYERAQSSIQKLQDVEKKRLEKKAK